MAWTIKITWSSILLSYLAMLFCNSTIYLSEFILRLRRLHRHYVNYSYQYSSIAAFSYIAS